ncbi:polyprenyl synthetase family protein, partial [Nonomuraea sp. NPDC001684]
MSPEFGKTLSSERPDGRAPIPPRRHDAAPGPAFSLTSPGLTLARDVEELVRPALRQAVETLPDPVRQVAEYHFGWSRGSAAAGGKSLRPSLALAGARAAGGDARQAVAGAVAVELVHNFSLLHDDVIDDDRTRRHRPAAWVRFGVGRAVLAGDALWALALEVLAETGEPAAIEVMIRTLADLMRGQSQDVAFESRDSITVEEYRAMAEGKTGALLGAACAVGALLGGASARQAEELDRFGRHLGVAFQCADDLLGIWGRADRTG